MSFRSAGFRPAVLGSALALVFALSASALMAQDAQPKTAAPAATGTAAAPASAASTAAAPTAEAKVTYTPTYAKVTNDYSVDLNHDGIRDTLLIHSVACASS